MCLGGLNPHLDEEECLQQEVEQHVGNDFADAREGVRFPAGDFEGEIRNVLMERREGIQNPLGSCHQEYTQSLFSGHPPETRWH